MVKNASVWFAEGAVRTREQNGKQEAFWGQVEGRLLPMLEGVADLTLDQLNDASHLSRDLRGWRCVNAIAEFRSTGSLPPKTQQP